MHDTVFYKHGTQVKVISTSIKHSHTDKKLSVFKKNSFFFRCPQKEISSGLTHIWVQICPHVTLEHKLVISSTGIFVEIDSNTLYGSKLYIFIL